MSFVDEAHNFQSSKVILSRFLNLYVNRAEFPILGQVDKVRLEELTGVRY